MATASMTNALFSAMDRRGDGIITRDEFNSMAFTAIHNNPLIKPGAPLAAPLAAPPAMAPAPAMCSGGTATLAAPLAGAPMPTACLGNTAPSVTFGGMVFSAPPAPSPLPSLSAPCAAATAPPLPPPLQPPLGSRPNSFAAAQLPSPYVAQPPTPISAQPPAMFAPQPPQAFDNLGASTSLVQPVASQVPPPPTESAFLATPPAVPGVTASAPTNSMTHALFSAMDRRGDGIITRDEFNPMAFKAVYNNPLVRPSKSLKESLASGQSFASTSQASQSFGQAAAPVQSFGALGAPAQSFGAPRSTSQGPIRRTVSNGVGPLSPSRMSHCGLGAPMQSFGAGLAGPGAQSYAAWC